MTIKIFDTETKAELGTLRDDQLQFLIDQLVEETSDDQDYYLHQGTLELLKHRGAGPELMAVLTEAMGDREGVEIRWERRD